MVARLAASTGHTLASWASTHPRSRLSLNDLRALTSIAEVSLEGLGLRANERTGTAVHASIRRVDVHLTRGARVWLLVSLTPTARATPQRLELPISVTSAALRLALQRRYAFVWPSEWADAARLSEMAWAAGVRSTRAKRAPR